MQILSTKIELVLSDGEQLLHVEVPSYVSQNFNTWHNVQIDSQNLTLPSLPRPVRIKGVMLLVAEQGS